MHGNLHEGYADKIDWEAAGCLPVERQRDRPAIGENGSSPMVLHGFFIQLYACRIFGIQQLVEMPSWYMGFTVMSTETQRRLRLDDRTEERDMVFVGIENVLHGSASQPNRICDIRAINQLKPAHDLRIAFRFICESNNFLERYIYPRSSLASRRKIPAQPTSAIIVTLQLDAGYWMFDV